MSNPASLPAILAFPILPLISRSPPGSTLDSDYLELAPGPRSRRGGRNGDAGNVGGAGDVSGDNENNQEDPLYASWKR